MNEIIANLRAKAVELCHQSNFRGAVDSIEQLVAGTVIAALEAKLPDMVKPLIDSAVQAAIAKGIAAEDKALQSVGTTTAPATAAAAS